MANESYSSVPTAVFFNAPAVEYTDVTNAATANLTVTENSVEAPAPTGETSRFVYNAPTITDAGSIEALHACLLAEVGSTAYEYCATFVSKFINKNVSDNSCFYPSKIGVTHSPLILLSELQTDSNYNEVGRITRASADEINSFIAQNGRPGDIIIYIGRASGDYVHCGIFFDSTHYTYDQGISGNVKNGSIYWYLHAVKGTREEATGAILIRPGKTGRDVLTATGSGTAEALPTAETSVTPETVSVTPGTAETTGDEAEITPSLPEENSEEHGENTEDAGLTVTPSAEPSETPAPTEAAAGESESGEANADSTHSTDNVLTQ